MVAGLVEPAEGELTYQEGDEDAYHFEPKGGLHYVGHLPGLKAVETLRETLEGWSGLYDLTPNIEGSLELFGLDNLADIQTKYLSEGQKRRLGLSRLIAIPKLLWLLDEPNAGLDKTSLKALYQLISDHRSGGGMVMIASHVEVGVDDVKVLDLSFPREGAS
jgi:heme exporter protein A